MQYFYSERVDISVYMRIMKAYRAKHKQTKQGGNKKMKTIWHRSKEGNLYMQEELKLYYLENVEFDRFEFCNFLAWIDNKEFVRIN